MHKASKANRDIKLIVSPGLKRKQYRTITQDILNEEVETAITGYTKAKKLKLIGTG
jgi:hypothetical protein